MLSIGQKKAVYTAVLKSYTVTSSTFTPSVIYSNQPLTTYPAIILNYLEEEIKEQNACGDYLGTPGSLGQRSLAWLSINVLVKKPNPSITGLNEVLISKDIAKQLAADIRTNWKSLSSGTVRFQRKSQTRDLTHIEQAAGTFDVARQQFDVYLAYDVIWQ